MNLYLSDADGLRQWGQAVRVIGIVTLVFALGMLLWFKNPTPGTMSLPMLLGMVFSVGGSVARQASRALKSSESRIEKLESELRDLKSKFEAQDAKN